MEPLGLTAREIAIAVHDGRLTAVEVVDAHLAHLARVDDQLGAFVAVRAGQARADAAAVDAQQDRRGLPLAGVPVAVKDVIDIAGLPTRHGSLATDSEVARDDHPLITRLREAGAIVLGKTRCPELSLWATTDDPEATCVSPWDPTRSAGGSSGGSAAAVAAGIVPLALGADGLGSVRHPAAACGVVGFRPGAPHLPEVLGGQQHWFGMSRFGVLGTTVEDVALLTDVLADTDWSSPAAIAGLNVAVSWRPPTPGVTVSGVWREAALEAGRLLHHAGHEVTRDDPPYDRGAVQAVISRWTQGAAQDVELLGLDTDRLQPRTRAHVAAGERLAKRGKPDPESAARWREKVQPFFETHDVLITPALARQQPAASAWHTRPWAANMASSLSAFPFAPAWNLADLPALVLPLWEEGGRPLAVQVVAGAGREAIVLAVARTLLELVPAARHAPGWLEGAPDPA